MKVTLHPLDIAVIISYFLVSILISIFFFRKKQKFIDYILCARRLTLPLFVGSLVSTWYGGILGVGEISYTHGAFYNWITQGLTWYISYFIFAFFLATKIQRSAKTTIPEQLETFYGSTAGKIGIILNYSAVIPSAYILSLGVLISLLFNINSTVAILLALIVAGFYSMIGGFWGEVYTDYLQFVCMCVGVGLLMIFSVFKLGGWDYLVMNLPASHFTLLGTWSSDFVPNIQNLIIWGFIALVTLVDPNFYQKCWAAENEKVAKYGVLLSILFWCFFDICTSFTGMYARAALPQLADAKMAFPLLADLILPVGIKGIVFAGMIATILSTIDSFSFVAATSLANDVYKRYIRPEASERQLVWVTRVIVIITFGVAFFIAQSITSIEKLWKIFGSIGSASLLVPLLFGFYRKMKPPKSAGVASMLGGLITVLVWMLCAEYKLFPFPLMYEIEALYPALLMSLGGYILFSYDRRSS